MNFTARIFLGALFLGSLVTAQAQLAWEQTQVELHPKMGDAEAVAHFKYQNKGKTPIKITAVRSSCGCTAASTAKDDVAPGEKGEVTATFKIGGRTGLQQKAITVETNDATQPSITLMLKAMIEQPLEIQPTFVFWQTGDAPNAKQIKVKLAKENNPAKLEVTSSNPQFSTKVEKGSNAGEYVIAVQPKDTAKAFDGTISIKSDAPQPAIVTARVTAPMATDR